MIGVGMRWCCTVCARAHCGRARRRGAARPAAPPPPATLCPAAARSSALERRAAARRAPSLWPVSGSGEGGGEGGRAAACLPACLSGMRAAGTYTLCMQVPLSVLSSGPTHKLVPSPALPAAGITGGPANITSSDPVTFEFSGPSGNAAGGWHPLGAAAIPRHHALLLSPPCLAAPLALHPWSPSTHLPTRPQHTTQASRSSAAWPTAPATSPTALRTATGPTAPPPPPSPACPTAPTSFLCGPRGRPWPPAAASPRMPRRPRVCVGWVGGVGVGGGRAAAGRRRGAGRLGALVVYHSKVVEGCWVF